MTIDPREPPLWTASLPGIGGRIKVQPDDFEVEEIPAYAPSGSGDFLYLWIEKRGMGADYFVRQIAKALGIVAGEVGTAGMKDRHAVTRQWVSLPATVEPQLGQLEAAGVRVLSVSRHSNKLRTGHLHGNRFRILIRETAPEAAERLPALVAQLHAQGLANFFGSQRFGNDGETLQLGMAQLRNEPLPLFASGKRPNLRHPFLRKLVLSAAQAALFNHYLAQRLQDGLMRTVLPGDVMAKWPAGALFRSDDTVREQARLDAHEIVPAGPIFGKKTFAAADVAAAREQAVLQEYRLTPTAFAGFGKLALGTRRHNLVYVDDLAWTQEAEGVRMTFTLPAGSYATMLLREVMKTALDTEEVVDSTE